MPGIGPAVPAAALFVVGIDGLGGVVAPFAGPSPTWAADEVDAPCWEVTLVRAGPFGAGVAGAGASGSAFCAVLAKFSMPATAFW